MIKRVDGKLMLLILLFICLESQSQRSIDKTYRVSIGEKVPNFLLQSIVNGKMRSAHINDFKGKLLILDYWFTGCKPCIESWPKLIKLQHQFGDKIQIMLVNHMESSQMVKDFIDKKNKSSGLNFDLPSVTEDTILHFALPPAGYPTIIWIDSAGIFRASTPSGASLNEENITDFISGSPIKFKTVLKNLYNFDMTSPLYLNGNGGDGKKMKWFSTVSDYTEKIDIGAQFLAGASDSTGYYISATNWPVYELIRFAYNSAGPYWNAKFNQYPRLPVSRLSIATSDSLKLFGGDTSKIYSYQLMTKEPSSINKLRKIMQSDLGDYFGLKIYWKKERRKCLVLAAQDTMLVSDFKDNKDGTRLMQFPKKRKYAFEDVSAEYLISTLTEMKAYYYSPYPIVDETNFKGKMDLILDDESFADWNELLADPATFNRLLSPYRMSFTLEDRDVDILVVENAVDDQSVE